MTSDVDSGSRVVRLPEGELAWVDGDWVPRDSFAIPAGDAGFVLGATVTEQCRTFDGELFLPVPHRERFAASLAAARITAPVPIAEVFDTAIVLARHNHRLLAAGDDLGVVVLATPGDLPAQHGGLGGRPRVAIHSFALAFPLWASAYSRGVALRGVGVTQVPASCWPVALKCRSRMHYHLARAVAADDADPAGTSVLATGMAEGLFGRVGADDIELVVSRDGVGPRGAAMRPAPEPIATVRLRRGPGGLQVIRASDPEELAPLLPALSPLEQGR